MKHSWFNISKFCIAQMVSFLKNVMRNFRVYIKILRFRLQTTLTFRHCWDLLQSSEDMCKINLAFFFPQEIPLNRSCFSFSGDKMETFERSQVIFHMSLKLKMATRIRWAILELILDSLTFDCKLIYWQMWGNLRHCWDLFTNSWEDSFIFLRRSLY